MVKKCWWVWCDVISEKNPTGYILDVDYNYPLAPETLAVSSVMLSNYCKKIADKYETKVGDVKKLIPDLDSKTNYVVHYRNFQMYLSLWIKLTKCHGVLKCKQSDWIEKIYWF